MTDEPTVVEPTGPTEQLATGNVPSVASLAMVAAAAGRRPTTIPSAASAATSISSAAGALRNEEIERTRLFIRLGWVITLVAIAAIPFVDAPWRISALFIGGMVLGMIASVAYHQAFADPARYTERSLLVLALICTVNGHLGVLFFGPFTATPLIVVVGLHFVARTELARIARQILFAAMACYAATTLPIIFGWIADPGVFASDRTPGTSALVTAMLFVLGAYALAYHTARVSRLASLDSIEELQRATRLASHREALMDELRADLERALQVGGPGRYTDQVFGGFRLGVVLGRGAMGEVYEATHVDTHAAAAVKLLRRELLADATQVARFVREVEASGALASPHVVRILDASAGDIPFLAMERLAGQTLAARLRAEPRLPLDAIAELCRHVGAGIDAAAAAGIVHRDLKPQNLMHAGVWKILDFGVATLADDSGTLTQGGVVGTPHYMAPEQAQGRPVDTRADLYALAAIAYRCVTGRHPFDAADTPSLLYAVVHRMPARPGELADVPDDIDRWFAIALAKRPGDRFPSGAALADAFAAARTQHLDPKLRRRADALEALPR